jgi:aspartate ammonia-lyase
MRMEHDLLGDKAIPDDVYYAVQTARALENFHITGVPNSQYPDLICALGIVKLAAARANFECKQLGEEIFHGIEGACQEIIDGQLHEQFKVDLIQGGAGTSTNVAAKEVIANRALEFMGFAKGWYEHCDPHNHINCLLDPRLMTGTDGR